MIDPERRRAAERTAAESFLVGSAYYYICTSAVAIGVWFGMEFLQRRPNHFQELSPIQEYDPARQRAPGVIAACSGWDGVWYGQIIREGYKYSPQSHSNVAFFPAFPLLAAAVVRLSGWSPEAGLLAVSHASLIGCFCVLAAYGRSRYSDQSPDVRDCVLLAFGLWPTTVFFRMAYSESLFLLLNLLTMYGMERRWRPPLIAAIIGVATATRPVGVALVPVLALYLWRSASEENVRHVPLETREGPRVDRWRSWCRVGRTFVFWYVWLLPLACWGLAAYMLFQYVKFGDALAFVRTQEHWAVRDTPPVREQFVNLITLKPIWAVYVPASEAYWALGEKTMSPLFSLQFANPIYFVFTVLLLAIGVHRKWLNRNEWLLGALLLLIPYIAHSDRASMWAHARYSAAVFPAYLVLGQVASRGPRPLTAVLFSFSALFLGVYSALFAAWYRVF